MNIETKIHRASLIVAFGLFVQLLSLIPVHPLAFVAFVSLGVPIMALGVGYFLLILLTSTHSDSAGK